MSVEAVILSILLPAIGWLLMNSNKTQQRLTRIETMLEYFLPDNHPTKKGNQNEQ